MSAVMAARIAGAKTIIAVDISPNRLTLAQELGATHAINPRERDPVAAIKDITGGGADFTLEATGRPAVLDQAIRALGIRGACGVAGVPGLGVMGSFNVMELLIAGLTIRGVAEGDSVPRPSFPHSWHSMPRGGFPSTGWSNSIRSKQSTKPCMTAKAARRLSRSCGSARDYADNLGLCRNETLGI